MAMKNLIVILDNGHGSNTKGKCSPDKSIYEWKYCREIVQDIYNQLVKEGIDARILVPEDNDISLKDRVKRANKIYNEGKLKGYNTILISVHLNAAGNGTQWMNASGWSGWVAETASNKSVVLEQLLYKHAEEYGLKGNRSVPVDRCWRANFYICKNTLCPAVLTENMFQDNKDDVQLLLSDEGRNKIVQLHVNAIKEYLYNI